MADHEGWQYSNDFLESTSFHSDFNPKRDFVRRRCWTRKCLLETPSLWQKCIQYLFHPLLSFSLDQESSQTSSYLLPEDTILLWATDTDGNVLRALISQTNPHEIKWINVEAPLKFCHVSIGVDLRLWAIDENGEVHIRLHVGDESYQYCGKCWSRVPFDENTDYDVASVAFKQLSVGHDVVWAVSTMNQLFFREKITKLFPEGTSWTKVDDCIEYVSVNNRNEVVAIRNDAKSGRIKRLVFRDGVAKRNLKGHGWHDIISVNLIF